MAFQLKISNEYSWPVEVKIPKERGGLETIRFDARYRRLPQDRIDEMIAQNREAQITDEALAREVLVGWSGITDENNDPYLFSEENRDALLANVVGLRSAVVRAFFESISGGARKN